ncbi:MAG: beta-lactamase family protein, partial [Verrucomicrobiales bacterium]|nr:beta-lactamase family protein [Verrucomicrobiales bacterium]
LGVSRGGRVVFLHAYGNLTPDQPLPETALFRLASVTKPITAAAIHRWSQAAGLGPAQLQRRVFNLASNGGVLNVTPAGTADPNLPAITVGHLLDHSAGWDRAVANPGDIPITRVRTAGIAMNQPDALPTRVQLIDWALQFPLNYPPAAALYAAPGGTPVVPGPGTTYSNFGYLILGEILQATAPGGYLGYLGSEVLSAANWIPTTDWGAASSLAEGRHPREPVYVSAEGPFSSVFDYGNSPAQLPAQYGGLYHLETMLAHGGLIASAQAVLQFGTLFSVAYTTRGIGATQSNDLGLPVSTNGLPTGSDSLHTGSLPGASTILRQRGVGAGPADDEVIFIAFNERHEPPAGTPVQDWALTASGLVTAYLDLITLAGTWPTERCDGFWVRLGPEEASSGHGGYHSNYRGLQSALNRVGDGSDLRLRPGQQNWRGTIRKRLRLDAPEGAVVLGR